MAETKNTKGTSNETVAGSVFNTLYAVDVSGRLDKKPRDKKGGPELSYLSWAWAWAEVKKRYPDAQYRIIQFDEHGIETEHGYPVQAIGNAGYLVHTELTIGGETYRMWLPVMDAHYMAVRKNPYVVSTHYSSYTVPGIDTMLINKALLRCLVKNMAIFGLGLTVYAGEDTPDADFVQPDAEMPDLPPEMEEPPVQQGQNAQSVQAPPVQTMPAQAAPDDPTEEEFDPNPQEEPDEPVDPIALQQAMDTQVAVDGKAYRLGDFVTKSRNRNKSQTQLAKMLGSQTPEVRAAALMVMKALNSGQIQYPAAAMN